MLKNTVGEFHKGKMLKGVKIMMRPFTVLGLLLICMAFQSPFLLGDSTQSLVLSPPFPAEPGPYEWKWDLNQHTLLFYRSDWDRPTTAVRAYVHGSDPRQAIAPLADFSDCSSVSIWDVASGPENQTVVATILYNGKRDLRHVLLTYDGSGKLRRVWDMWPYHHHKIASDRAGNIFALGHRVDSQPSSAHADDYILTKYSPGGKVVNQFLSRTLFPDQSDLVETSASTGENFLLVTENEILVYLAAPREALGFDLEGTLLRRTSLGTQLDQAAQLEGFTRGEVVGLAQTGPMEISLQVRFVSDKGTRPAFELLMFNIETSRLIVLSRSTSIPSPGRLAGADQQGQLIFVGRSSRGDLSLISATVSKLKD